MGYLEPEKCCCCCELKAGCLVYGYFGAIMSGIGVIEAISYLVDPDQTVKVDGSIKEVKTALSTRFLVELLFLSLLLFVICVFLLVGVHRGLQQYVRYAYVSLGVMAALNVLANLCDPTYWYTFGFLGLIHLVLGSAFMFYLILCIRSYYLLLRDNQSVNQGLV